MSDKPLIAIVEDDESAREGTIDLLKAMGFVAKGCRCAEDFLESSDLARTAVLITDMRMPGMSGLELNSHLTRIGRAIPTIVVTAFPNERDRSRAIGAGVICYLVKPFHDTELLNCIHSALGSSQGG
jgi:FixJ family two-component response regulator